MFRDRLEEFLQREFDARVNDLLGGSLKPRYVSLNLALVLLAYLAQKPSGELHAEIARSVQDLLSTALGAAQTVAAHTGLRVNKLSPLERLSDDVLVLILLHLDNHDTFIATKVSRRWRTITLYNPSLWASIDMSCRPVEFERRFQLFTARSKNAPLDIKLVLESVEANTSHVNEEDEETLRGLWNEQCESDVAQQLTHEVQKIVMAPGVFTRVRTLDITSMITSNPDNYDISDLYQPTPKLRLAASPSLRRLRLNWAEPDVHELRLILDSKIGAYDSVSSLALGAVDNLEEVLPRFPGVIDLSLWLDQSEVYTPSDIQLADLCIWMPKLRYLEIVEVPNTFATKPLVTKPSLHRLVLHGEFARDVFTKVSQQMDLKEIPELSLLNNTLDTFKTGFIPVASGPADQLSVYDSPKWLHPRLGYHLYAEDSCRRLRYLHSMYKRLHCEEMVSYAIINTNIEALYDALPANMPQLVTLRIHLDRFRSVSDIIQETSPRLPRSCPALAHLELYVGYDRTSDEGDVATGVEIMNWIALHLQDFPKPLHTLRIVGMRVGADLDALNSLARTVLFTPTPLFE